MTVTATFATLKFAEFAAPITVINEPVLGTLPLRITNTSVAVVVAAEALTTYPRVGPVLSLYDPSKYSGMPGINSTGAGLNGDVMYWDIVSSFRPILRSPSG